MDKEAIIIPQFPGGIQSRPDPRDHQWSEVGFGSSPFDWNKGFDIESNLSVIINKSNFKIPVKDQNGSGSCGGQAWSYLGSVLEAIATKTFEERSAKFIYSQTFVNQPGGGSAGRDNASLVTKQGWGTEKLTPSYNKGNPPSEAFMERPGDITAEARTEAKKALSSSYANVHMTIDEIAQALRDNNGVIILIEGSNNGTWLSANPKAPKGETIWRHWLYIGKAKMINGIKHVGVLNSWGVSVGDSGWQWINEDYFKSGHILEAWTHIFNTETPPDTYHHYFAVPLKLGDKGDEVIALQKALQVDGEFPNTVPTTGLYGDLTRRAVLAFQIKYQVGSTQEIYSLNGEIVGPKTRVKLNQLFGN